MHSRLKSLQLKAKHQVYTLLSGHHLSNLQGEGYDFSGLREYQAGDDIRKINWMITAKQSKPYIKEFHDSRELSVVVTTLMDGSLYFGQGNAKQEKLTEVATLLGYACEQQGDLFSAYCYTQDSCLHTPPTKHLYEIEAFSKMLFDTPLLHSTLDSNASIKNLFNRIHKPSLIFVLSDFLEEVDLALLAQKHEVIAIIIRDKEEDSPKVLGEVTLSSPCDSKKLKTYFGKRTIEKYLEKLQENDAKLAKHFSTHKIRHIKIMTGDEAVKKLRTLFV